MGDELKEGFERAGFALVEGALAAEAVDALCDEADRLLATSGCRGGARNMLSRSERFRAVGESGAPSKIARRILGQGARPTKLTLFNKTPDANWLIRWHQDLAITVRERRDVSGFSAWSVKEGVQHVRPPAEILKQVLAIRLHLDDTPAANGALRVVPGSHRLGRLSREEIERVRSANGELVCEVPRGGAMLMSPLLLHASSKASEPDNRRVLHFEYSAADLPGGLEWA